MTDLREFVAENTVVFDEAPSFDFCVLHFNGLDGETIRAPRVFKKQFRPFRKTSKQFTPERVSKFTLSPINRFFLGRNSKRFGRNLKRFRRNSGHVRMSYGQSFINNKKARLSVPETGRDETGYGSGCCPVGLMCRDCGAWRVVAGRFESRAGSAQEGRGVDVDDGGRQGKEGAVETVEYTAMAGEEASAVFQMKGAFQQAFDQIAPCTEDNDHSAEA